jgi:hypothetical protein
MGDSQTSFALDWGQAHSLAVWLSGCLPIWLEAVMRDGSAVEQDPTFLSCTHVGRWLRLWILLEM